MSATKKARLAVVGLGPGDPRYLTPEADAALAAADVLYGYGPYLDRLTQRPSATVWSPLEYACHVRDVYRIYDERLELMLTRDDPLYQNWDQDASAVTDRYNEQSPATVERELAEAAARLADRFDTVSGDQWSRPGRRSDGKRFTIESFARYMIHDPIHHLHDVGYPT